MRHPNHLERSQLIKAPIATVFEFFSNAANLEIITPDFLRFRILTPMPVEMRTGTHIDYALSLYGVPIRWRTVITEWTPGVRFIDEQEAGPYAYWRHVHEFESRGADTLVTDAVEYREPLGPLGQIAHVLFVSRTLNRIFDFRHVQVQRLFDNMHGADTRPTPTCMSVGASSQPTRL